MTDIPLPSGHVALIDDTDFFREAIVEFADGTTWRGVIGLTKWRAAIKPHTIYVINHKTIGGKVREIRLHRAILDAKPSDDVDHVNHNGLDNRRENLRIATSGQNAFNRSPNRGRQLPKGVSLHRKSGKYEAYIRYRRQKFHLGLHKTPELAAAAYDRAAHQLFGSFAQPNAA
jgi:hypothetical protein